jgi:hypothetical protein
VINVPALGGLSFPHFGLIPLFSFLYALGSKPEIVHEVETEPAPNAPNCPELN